MEITHARSLVAALQRGGPFDGMRVQNVDLDDPQVATALRATADLSGLVVLGGPSDPGLTSHLVHARAVVFPAVPDSPVNVYRHRLYTADELYGGLDRGYGATVDSLAYHWTLDRRAAHDAYCTVLRAIHDDAITDALGELSVPGGWVGVMGGHAAHRGGPTYAVTAALGHQLARAGRVVVTGGGPGAMEAANLGALAQDQDEVDRACRDLAAVPSFTPDVTAWARAGLAVRDRLVEHHRAARADDEHSDHGERVRSLGIPTWFYGHEPPNVFSQRIAKYFSNALREDTLLAHSTGGVIVQAGAAGTVQEVFQLATRLYYSKGDSALPPLVLVGVAQWRDQLPVWDVLRRLGRGRAMADAIHLVDTIEEAVAVVTDSDPA